MLNEMKRALSSLQLEHSQAQLEISRLREALRTLAQVPQSNLAKACAPPVYDLYDFFSNHPILARPAMWLGRKSITAFGDFYTGLSELGGRSHGSERVFVLKNELWNSGFVDWAHARHAQPNPICLWQMYCLVENAKDPTAGPYVIEERAFDLFCADLKEFRNEKKDFVCSVDNCWKSLEPGEPFICSRHKGFQTCYYCNKPFDASGPDYPKGIILTDWCCLSCQSG